MNINAIDLSDIYSLFNLHYCQKVFLLGWEIVFLVIHLYLIKR